ncbi:hypothetical protein DLM75_15140 [Leptospira stimsonii]|uniref:Uncharacterized protein n=1 Tax=Leptospira stimsonii TaxID=2202203 RepID=A0A396Z162_9LEPT|nr:hypothetical protein DLM75_15140 [Leptospira stimsonii]
MNRIHSIESILSPLDLRSVFIGTKTSPFVVRGRRFQSVRGSAAVKHTSDFHGSGYCEKGKRGFTFSQVDSFKK